jgi:hypothetical protein
VARWWTGKMWRFPLTRLQWCLESSEVLDKVRRIRKEAPPCVWRNPGYFWDFSNFADGWGLSQKLSQPQQPRDRGAESQQTARWANSDNPDSERKVESEPRKREVPAEAAEWGEKSSFGLAQVFCAMFRIAGLGELFPQASRETNSCFQTKDDDFRRFLCHVLESVGSARKSNRLLCHALV